MDVAGSVKDFLFKKDSATIDNIIFKIHYRVTYAFVLACMALVSARQYFGDPISCISDLGDVMSLYCWIHSTFSVPSGWGKGSDEYGEGNPLEVGRNVPHPGVAPLDNNQEVVHHKYYQWVVFVLFFQAMMFHLPRLIWKHAEGGLAKWLVGNLTDPMTMISKEERKERVEIITRYFRDSSKTHGGYALNFFFCEILTFINIIGQMYLTDRFLGYQFTTYGWDVFTFNNMNPEDRPDPMNMVFPKVTKCTFFKYGSSGTTESRDALCILALNIINEKVYTFLWFWFVIVAIITAISLIYRIFVLVVPSLRVQVIVNNSLYQVDRKQVEKCLSCPTHSWLDQIGDYWLLFLLSRNLTPIAMKELIEELQPVLNPEPHFGYPTLDANFEKESSM